MEKAKLKPGWLKRQIEESLKRIKEEEKCSNCHELMKILRSINDSLYRKNKKCLE